MHIRKSSTTVWTVALALALGVTQTARAGGREAAPAAREVSAPARVSSEALREDADHPRSRRAQQRERRVREREARADERRLRRERESHARGEALAGEGGDSASTPTALPNGGQAGSVSSQAIALPSGEGSIQGMGESFTPSLSSGTGTFSVPITLPPGRTGVQPSLALAYSTSSGNGSVGLGWGLSIPFIARQTDRGLPRYRDQARYHAEEDRFIYNGGQELVPVDNAAIALVDASGRGYETTRLPIGVDGTWQQYRARLEGGFMRFFRAPDSKRWVVVGMDGTRFDFGLLPANEGPSEVHSERALQSEYVGGTGRIFAWHLTRMSDVHGSTVYYTYQTDGGLPHIAAIHYVSPNDCATGSTATTRACTAALSDYAMRVAFTYAQRPDVYASYVTGWRTDEPLRLMRITVTAAQNEVGERYLVRRYHLTYDPSSFLSLLASVQLEGRRTVQHPQFDAQVFEHTHEDDLTPAITGLTLPPMRFRYSTMPTQGPQVAGFGGVSSAVHTIEDSPRVSLDDPRTDLFDVNTDGLPDVVVTDPARYRTPSGEPASGVFWNGFTGANAQPAGRTAVFSGATPVAVTGSLSGTLSFASPNIVPMDVDGDGRLDMLHMPRLDEYGYFTPARTNTQRVVSPAQQGWRWTYAKVQLPRPGDDPRIDLVRDGTYYRVFDVNNDHLIDVVRTTGTVMQTWMNLGWTAGGDGRFGQASWNGTEWVLSSDPIETCILNDGHPLDFGSAEVRLADMNGDGIDDIVRLRRDRIVYWAGRGEALWGDGSTTCTQNQGAGREIEMTSSPRDIPVELQSAYFVDVNADGTSDLVQVRYREVDVWFNRAGRSWTERLTVPSPFEPSFAPRTRLTDIDGSGTVDLVYGNAGAWKFMDLAGGMRPRLLVGVENGFGATTSLEYGSSADDYVQDLKNAATCTTETCGSFFWDGVRTSGGCDAKLQRMSGECVYRSSGSPVISSVVRASETSDHFDLVGREETVVRSEYAYHNGYYEGIEQEFRGFGAADARAIGDASAPTQWTRTWFHQGRRPDTLASDRLADNPYEALKGREYLTETFNEQGQYLSSAHATLSVRTLGASVNARSIVYAYVHQTDTFTYGHAPYAAADLTTTLPALRFETVNGGAIPSAATSNETHRVNIRAGTYGWVRSTTDTVDNLGQVIRATAHGRLHSDADGATTSVIEYHEAIVTHAEPANVTGSPDGWLFRSAHAYITDGTEGATQYNDVTTTFDAFGQAVGTSQPALLVGFAPFAFIGGTSGLSQTNQTMVASSSYDVWGNVLATCAGGAVGTPSTCLRYRKTTYGDPYGQFPSADAIAVSSETGTHCSEASPFCMLTTSGTWDRGFGSVKSATDPNGQMSYARQDGLGRTTFVQPPTSSGCDAPPTVTHYEIGLGGLPVHAIESVSVNRAAGTCDEVASSRIRTRAYVDGLGRSRATLTYAYGGTQWEQMGIEVVNRRGLPHRAYEGVFVTAAGAPTPLLALRVPAELVPVVTSYDAFGRAKQLVERDTSVSTTSYGAFEARAFDALDRGTDPTFAGTPSLKRVDGHGRLIQQVEALRSFGGAATEYIHLRSTYRVDGAVISVTRFGSASDGVSATAFAGHSTTRLFYVDTAGRRVGTSDPDTNSRTNSTVASNRWRYLFNPVGDLVAVRDPRGCGQDFFYDRSGRVVGEAYVACGEAQPSGEYAEETIPAGSISLGSLGAARTVDVRTYFDTLPPWAPSLTGVPSEVYGRGRAIALADRGQRAVVAYDVRGQTVWSGRQMVLIPEEAANVPDTLTDPPAVFRSEAVTPHGRVYDTSVTYTSTTTYDHLGRVTGRTYPRDPDWLAEGGSGSAPSVRGAITYDHRGLPYRTSVSIGSETFRILESLSYGPNRLPTQMTYGETNALTSTWSAQYDLRQRPTRSTVQNHRAARPTTAISLGEEAVPFDLNYTWDVASNLTMVEDHAPTAERVAGQMPQRQIVSHDSLYRVARIVMSYRTLSGDWSSDVDTNWRDERERPNADGSTHQAADPMRREPAPRVSGAAPSRVTALAYRYDWLGNMTSWDDPGAGAFHERELGRILNGAEGTSDERPSALYMASDLPETGTTYSATTDRGGYLRLQYGEGGNVETLTVHGQCRDASSSDLCTAVGGADDSARDAHLRAHCTCAVEHHYQYRWDELNRIAEARRYDRAGAGTWDLAARQRYTYDSANQRTVKQTLDPTAREDAPNERIGLYVLPGDYERVGVRRDGAAGKYVYDADLKTESQYSIAGARVVWKPGLHSGSVFDLDKDHRIVVAYTNLVETTTVTQDISTGLLVEQSTFLPCGARETSRTGGSASVQQEPLGFTGKEEDDEVGLVYFGERYLIQHVARWASADPLAIHGMGGGEAGNAYHYVSGSVLQGRDPIGLWPMDSAKRRAAQWADRLRTDSARVGLPVSVMATVQFLARTGAVIISDMPGRFNDGEYNPISGHLRLGETYRTVRSDLRNALSIDLTPGEAQAYAERVAFVFHELVHAVQDWKIGCEDAMLELADRAWGGASGYNVVTRDRLTREAFAEYSERAVYTYLTTLQGINRTVARYSRGEISLAAARELVAGLRVGYDSGLLLARRDAGYTPISGRPGLTMSDEMAEYADEKFLDGGFDSFDEEFGAELDPLREVEDSTETPPAEAGH